MILRFIQTCLKPILEKKVCFKKTKFATDTDGIQSNFRFALDVNVTDSSGATPLMLAALVGNVEIIAKLVSKGAHLNTQDSANGWTALMQVC